MHRALHVSPATAVVVVVSEATVVVVAGAAVVVVVRLVVVVVVGVKLGSPPLNITSTAARINTTAMIKIFVSNFPFFFIFFMNRISEIG